MANEQYAFLEQSKVPSREEWQEVINSCGFDFQLDPDLKPFEDSGFLPCKLMGRDAGFEIYYDGSPETLEHIRDIAPGKNFCISFRWGGSMVECASVMIASYALAKHFDAVVSYEGEDPYTELENFLSDTNSIIKEAVRGF